MSQDWRRCEQCRKVLRVQDFDGDANVCRACGEKATRAAARSAGPVATGSRAGTRPPSESGEPRVAAASAGSARTRRAAPVDVRGRGDREVRVRRARVRALERLAEAHPEDFERLLAEERVAERL